MVHELKLMNCQKKTLEKIHAPNVHSCMAYNELPRYGSVHQKMNEKGRRVYTSIRTHAHTQWTTTQP